MTKVIVDGKPVLVNAPDWNTPEGDPFDALPDPVSQGITSINQPTELGESLKSLNDDAIERETRMSGIDMRTRLHPYEIGSILALDALVALKICPSTCLSFTRQKKRLNVSLNGEGRKEIVDIVAGKREHDMNSGGVGGFKNFLGMGK